jgi:hypothetical protein
MKKLIVASIVFFFLALGSLNAAEEILPKSDETSALYYPLKLGHQWDYDVNSEGRQGAVSSKVAKVETIDNEELYRLDALVGGQVVTTEHMRHDKRGLYRCRLNGAEFDPPILLLKNSPSPGDSWEAKTVTGGQTYTVKCEVGEEVEVTVPAGKYKALQLKVSLVVNGATILSDYWLAENIGVVKQHLSIAGQETTMSLSKFTEGEKP